MHEKFSESGAKIHFKDIKWGKLKDFQPDF